MKSNCASWVGTCKHKRNAFVWGTEWGLNSLSVFGLVTAIQTIATYSKVALHFLSVSIFWTDATHSSISWVLQPPNSDSLQSKFSSHPSSGLTTLSSSISKC